MRLDSASLFIETGSTTNNKNPSCHNYLELSDPENEECAGLVFRIVTKDIAKLICTVFAEHIRDNSEAHRAIHRFNAFENGSKTKDDMDAKQLLDHLQAKRFLLEMRRYTPCKDGFAYRHHHVEFQKAQKTLMDSKTARKNEVFDGILHNEMIVLEPQLKVLNALIEKTKPMVPKQDVSRWS